MATKNTPTPAKAYIKSNPVITPAKRIAYLKKRREEIKSVLHSFSLEETMTESDKKDIDNLLIELQVISMGIMHCEVVAEAEK